MTGSAALRTLAFAALLAATGTDRSRAADRPESAPRNTTPAKPSTTYQYSRHGEGTPFEYHSFSVLASASAVTPSATRLFVLSYYPSLTMVCYKEDHRMACFDTKNAPTGLLEQLRSFARSARKELPGL